MHRSVGAVHNETAASITVGHPGSDRADAARRRRQEEASRQGRCRGRRAACWRPHCGYQSVPGRPSELTIYRRKLRSSGEFSPSTPRGDQRGRSRAISIETESRRPEKHVSSAPRQRPEPIVQFARPHIRFYDEHVIDLYYRFCALYRMGEDTKEKSHGNLDRKKRRTRPILFSVRRPRLSEQIFRVDKWRPCRG